MNRGRNHVTGSHPGQARLVALLDRRLDSSEAGEIYGHLAFCEDCAGVVRALSEVREDFDAAWAEFTATLARDARQRLEDSAPEIFGHGSKDVVRSGRFAVALDVFVDGSRSLAEIAAQGIKSLSLALDLFQLVPMDLPRGAGDRSAPKTPDLAEIQILGPGIGSATVVADARRRAISILLHPPEGMTLDSMLRDHAPRAVLLRPGGERRSESLFALIEGADYLLAEFENLDQVSWIVGLDFGS